MPDFIVTRRATGEVVYAYAADEATDFPEFPFAQFNHTLKATIQQPAPAREISGVSYLRRFTQAERIAIRAAAVSSAVQMLEQVGLIAAGRTAEILA